MTEQRKQEVATKGLYGVVALALVSYLFALTWKFTGGARLPFWLDSAYFFLQPPLGCVLAMLSAYTKKYYWLLLAVLLQFEIVYMYLMY